VLKNTTSRLCTLACLVVLAGCSRTPERPTPSENAPSPSAAPSSGLTHVPAPPTQEPSTLFTAEVSAYAAEVALDEDAVYLLTPSAAFRLVPGRPAERWALDLGLTPALAGGHFVYWSKGELLRAPKRGGDPSTLAKVPGEPQRLAASGDYVAWLEKSADRGFVIWTLDGSRPREVLIPRGDVAALALLDDQVFFVEQLPEAKHRLGVVPLSGGEPRYSSEKKGRTPAMLAAAGELFFYDGPTTTVRRVSTDLTRERVIARGLICSPLAVAERVYCAQPAGLVELPAEGGSPRALAAARGGPITKIVASAKRVAWLVDAGPDRLSVQTLP
jgi:hypothetical protein